MSLLHLEPLPQRAGKSDLLAFLESTGGLRRSLVGRIELRGRQATVEVPEAWQDRLVKALDGQPLAGRRLRVWADSPTPRAAGGEDHFDRLSRLLELESRAEAIEAAEYAASLSPAEAERSGTWTW